MSDVMSADTELESFSERAAAEGEEEGRQIGTKSLQLLDGPDKRDGGKSERDRLSSAPSKGFLKGIKKSIAKDKEKGRSGSGNSSGSGGGMAEVGPENGCATTEGSGVVSGTASTSSKGEPVAVNSHLFASQHYHHLH